MHNRLWDKTYKGASNLIFWMNGSMYLHSIVKFPVYMDRLLHQGENRLFNLFECMYSLNIRKDVVNGLCSAFQFWNLPKTRIRFDELLDNFLFAYKDFSNNPESTDDATSFGMMTMMKAIINLQRTILSCPEGVFHKDSFIDNTLINLRMMSKEKRDLTLMMELKRILWEVNVPSEYISNHCFRKS